MLLKTKLLFELSVYRISEDSYYKEFDIYKATHTFSTIEAFGGLWEYNDIIGYLKFYIYGNTQIRVEYFETSQKKKFKTKTKQFILKSDSFCKTPISKIMDNHKLIKVIEDTIDEC